MTMKMNLPVPVRKVAVGATGITFEHEQRWVDVMVVTRTRAGRRGWHYYAHFAHPDAHPDYPRVGVNGTLTSWIRRADHPRWKPPVFSDDRPYSVQVEAA